MQFTLWTVSLLALSELLLASITQQCYLSPSSKPTNETATVAAQGVFKPIENTFQE
jgi:hypothetical protein